MNPSPVDALYPPPADPSPDGRTFINPSLWFVDRDGYRVVFCRHEPLYRLAVDDLPHLRYVAVLLRQSELATQAELANAFGHSVAAQRRWERRFQQDGLDGLDHHGSSGRGRKLDRTQEQFVRRWFQQGFSQAEIARRLGVGAATVDRTCKRLGLHRPPTPVPELPGVSVEPLAAEPEAPTAERSAAPPVLDPDVAPAVASVEAGPGAAPAVPLPRAATAPAREAGAAATPLEPVACPGTAAPGDASDAAPATLPTPSAGEPARPPASFTLDHDPSNRQGDRFLARQGLLADAVPLFADAEHLPRAGVLLAVPVLIDHQVLPVFEQVYESLHPSFYGLRTLVVTLILMALLRIKRPENLKEYAPDDLGRLLGLDRAPEVKTVRRKLTELAARTQGKRLLDALARQRIAQQEEALAFLYVDGHVREYHGQEPLAKAKKPQSAVAKPAATDFWVNDADGVPLLVVTNPMNAALTQVLLPILRDVKALVPSEQRITVLFDRGGFSPKFRTPDIGPSRSERLVGLDGQPELEVRAREARAQGVHALTHGGQGLRPVRRGLGRHRHAEFVGSYLQAAGRLKGGVQQGSAFVFRARVMLLEHAQQLRLDLIGNHLERIHDQALVLFQRLQVAGRNPFGQLPQLLFQPLDTGLGSLQLAA
jgi:transposase